MKNKIYCITKRELDSIRQQLYNQEGVWIAEIDGKVIHTWSDYAHEIVRTFRFPTPCENSIDAYLDWLRDLDWLGKEAYILIIKNFDVFLQHDMILRKQIMDDFQNVVFPWWEKDIEKYCVGGKAKNFNVYLVA